MVNKFNSNTASRKIGSIDNDTLWPDAWKVDISIKDLTPNNFNTYIEYFVNGWSTSNVKELGKKGTEATWAKTAQNKLEGLDLKRQTEAWAHEQQQHGRSTANVLTAKATIGRGSGEGNAMNVYKRINTKDL